MDISGVSVAGVVSATVAQKTIYAQQDVQVEVFKQFLDAQTQNAKALIATLPSPQALPDSLGNTINTKV